MENTDILKAVLVALAPVLVALAGLFVAFSKSIPSLMQFYSERVLKRYAFFLSEAKGNEELSGIVHAAQEAEILRGIFGKPVSPKMASAIIALYRTREFSLPELIACFEYNYMSLGDDDSLEIKLGIGSCLGVYVFAPLFIILAPVLIYILRQQSVSTAPIEIVLFVIYFLVIFVLRGYRERFELAREAKKKLAKIKASNPIGGSGAAPCTSDNA